ncbi:MULTISPECIES: very short patch repair endonuclease [unclassified Mesorhizobium]|nr:MULTISPECIES: very short patch repair endonuclease [unclassified Mesorhizobium]ESX18242.1 DNA glycosylase [Mesorhizobium sp. LSJC255A00]ESX24192.1 DNA mismatch repair protein Vsr [Mesorhizobium sp. LSHC440B00]ESX31169.1 DNA mismatch repair protein Vsr [Mesorhizobium sp. LSHC432A00]ESX68458.1 DNA mismatch repair protein Vsr [Mesorhizobium sp. LSHC414A00]ESY43508.1 DNA glycosylase [Mesorhizobium sp. LNJC384A00]
MTDVVDKATRSRMMAGIQGKNTIPELMLRKALHAKGIRYRLHYAKLPGRPDIVFPRFKSVCFVHGCFWHRHPGCRFATTPATRPEFWQTKFASNVARDHRNRDELMAIGWRVATVWECALQRKDLDPVVTTLIGWLIGGGSEVIEIGGG